MRRQDWDDADAATRHRIRIQAIAETRRVDAVFSHTSAAVIHGLPLLDPPGAIVHAITDPAVRRRASAIAWHRRELADSDVVEIDGLLVTSLPLTLLDLARTDSFAAAVVALDAALDAPEVRPRWDSRASRIHRDELFEQLDAIAGSAGVRRARDAVSFADGRAESVGESLSRVQMFAWGIPLPELQTEVECPSGAMRRVDFSWNGASLIGEFDGRVKYGRMHGRGDSEVADIVWAEKRREDDLRATGASVVRWLWNDATDGTRLVALLDRYGITTARRQPRPVFTKGTR